MIDYGTPEWVTWAQYVGIVAGSIIAVLPFFKAFREWVRNIWAKLKGKQVLREDLEKLRADIAAALADQYSKLHEEMTSLGEQISEVLSGMQGFSSRMGIVESMLRLSADQKEDVGSVYFDEHGGITYASKTLCDWMDCDRAELMGMRWLKFVQLDQRATIRAEIPQANDEHREVRLELNMGPDGKAKALYLFVMAPMPDNPPLQAWAGFFKPIAA